MATSIHCIVLIVPYGVAIPRGSAVGPLQNVNSVNNIKFINIYLFFFNFNKLN